MEASDHQRHLGAGDLGAEVRRRAVQAKEPVRHRGDLSDQG